MRNAVQILNAVQGCLLFGTSDVIEGKRLISPLNTRAFKLLSMIYNRSDLISDVDFRRDLEYVLNGAIEVNPECQEFYEKLGYANKPKTAAQVQRNWAINYLWINDGIKFLMIEYPTECAIIVSKFPELHCALVNMGLLPDPRNF